MRKITERRIVHAIDLVPSFFGVSILSSLAGKSQLQLRQSCLARRLSSVKKYSNIVPFSFAGVVRGFRKPENAMDTSMSSMSPLTCPQCGRTYKMKRNLKTHMKFECGGQRNFMCHLCPSKYTQNISLRRHLLQRHNLYLAPKFSVPRRIFSK